MWTRRLSEIAIVFALATAGDVAFADEPAPAADPLDPYRERFRVGLEKYKEGAYAEAIVVWEAIYREIGPDRGYRLAFNLARAYDKFGDATRAAESYETYAREVERRREAGEVIEENVARQESDARARLAELATTRGRIRVESAGQPTAVRIDSGEPRLAGFVAYVSPGRHVVTFESGKDVTRTEIEVKEGEIVSVAPPPPEAPAPAPEPPPSPPPPARFETKTERPFSGAYLLAGGTLTVVSLVLPIAAYAEASAIRDDYENAPTREAQEPLVAEYDSARTLTYTTLAVPVVLGVATAALTAWWILGTREVKVPIAATAGRLSVSF